MNPKIRKVDTDIEKTEAKISELQGKLKDLREQKTELENTEILQLVRSVNATPEQLAELLQAFRKGGLPTIPQNKEDKQDA